MPRTALAVMARYPEIGAVKTRLARAIGADRAYVLYRAFLQDIAVRFGGSRRALIWVFYPPDREFSAAVGAGSRCIPQRGSDLGERMHNCFRHVCAAGFERVIMIGADVPHIDDGSLDEAESALDRADVVLGPSEDGGYYLVAMQQPHDIFTGVEMGTGLVLDQTLQRARAAQLQVHLLPRSFDIDEAADLLRLRAMLLDQGSGASLPHTAAVLAGWRQC